MKQLEKTLQAILSDLGIVMLSNTEKSLYVYGRKNHDMIPQTVIERTVRFCYLNGLQYYFDCHHSALCLYRP